jgi:hypothetical protein
MGTKPGERMMGQLERRAEAISGEFNSQDIANTLWATCFFSVYFESSRLPCGFASQVFSPERKV